MLPISIFVLVLLGGFIFVTRWHPTKHYVLRVDGYRLIFCSLTAGIISLFISALAHIVVFQIFPKQTVFLRELIHGVIPVTNAGKAALSFVLSGVVWKPLNLLGTLFYSLSDKAAVDRAIMSKGDPMEMFLRRALGDKSLISISTKSGKVYIGKLLVNFNPASPLEFISLWTTRSGHREKDTQALRLDVDYDRICGEIESANDLSWKAQVQLLLNVNPNLSIDRLYRELNNLYEDALIQNRETVIPVSEIQSVNYFDYRIYEECQKTSASSSSSPNERGDSPISGIQVSA